MPLLINPPPGHWSRADANRVETHPDNDLLSEQIINNSTWYDHRKGEIGCATVGNGYGFNVLDGTGQKHKKLVCTSQMIPKVVSVPASYDWVFPWGTDGNIYIVDRENDVLYMVWGARWLHFPSWMRLQPVLLCNNAAALTLPMQDRYTNGKRKDSKVKAAYSKYMGNHPDFNGAGVIVRPVTKEALNIAVNNGTYDLGHALSGQINAYTFGFPGATWAPGSKSDSNTTGGNVAGVWFQLFFTQEKIDQILLSTPSAYRNYVHVLVVTAMKRGISVDVTGPAFQIIHSDVDMPKILPFNLKDPGVGVRVLKPCMGWVGSETPSEKLDWYDMLTPQYN